MSPSRLALAFFSTVAAATYLGSLSTIIGIGAQDLPLEKFIDKVPDAFAMALFGSLLAWPVAAVASVVAIALIGALLRLRIFRTPARRTSVAVSVLAATGAVVGAALGTFSLHVQHHAGEVHARHAFAMVVFVAAFATSGAICGAVFAAIMGWTAKVDTVEG